VGPAPTREAARALELFGSSTRKPGRDGMSPLRRGGSDVRSGLIAERDQAIRERDAAIRGQRTVERRMDALEADVAPIIQAHHEREEAAARASGDADFHQALADFNSQPRMRSDFTPKQNLALLRGWLRWRGYTTPEQQGAWIEAKLAGAMRSSGEQTLRGPRRASPFACAWPHGGVCAWS
jgi:hypothetical protein